MPSMRTVQGPCSSTVKWMPPWKMFHTAAVIEARGFSMLRGDALARPIVDVDDGHEVVGPQHRREAFARRRGEDLLGVLQHAGAGDDPPGIAEIQKSLVGIGKLISN